jgi:hypothetical protein
MAGTSKILDCNHDLANSFVEKNSLFLFDKAWNGALCSLRYDSTTLEIFFLV